jgi:arabinosyltransferase
MAPTLPPADEGLELPSAAHSAMNIGVMFFRHSDGTREFVDEWLKQLDAEPALWDQNAFNNLARAGFHESKVHPSSKGLFYGFNGRLVIGVLPVASFASGHTYHVQHLYQVRPSFFANWSATRPW